MTLVALMTQPLRSEYCLAYLTQANYTRAIILTAERRHSSTWDLPANVSLRHVENPIVYHGPLHHRWSRSRRALAEWSRSGSRLGRLTGQLGRKIERWSRSLTDGGREARPEHREAPEDMEAAAHDPIHEALLSINVNHPISRIVVFDLFDLPSALDFALPRDIELVVR